MSTCGACDKGLLAEAKSWRCSFPCSSGKRLPPVVASRAIWRNALDSDFTPSSQSQLLQRAVGACPVVEHKIGDVKTPCLLDTGSQVSTITNYKFFRKYLHGEDEDVLLTSGWLKLTAANGLHISYLDYLELEVIAMGLMLPNCGFLVVKDPVSAE